jgi:hypothetical protein
MDKCERCIKAVSARNCKGCASNPSKFILSFSVKCDKSCSQYVDRVELACSPVTGNCLRADYLVSYLKCLGVLKDDD